MLISYLLERMIVLKVMTYVPAEFLGKLHQSHHVLSIGGGSSSKSVKTIITEAKGVKTNVGPISSFFFNTIWVSYDPSKQYAV